jgi:hypothetical protein
LSATQPNAKTFASFYASWQIEGIAVAQQHRDCAPPSMQHMQRTAKIVRHRNARPDMHMPRETVSQGYLHRQMQLIGSKVRLGAGTVQ